MDVQIYLYFPGNAREAMDFYSEVFDSPIEGIMTYGELDEDAGMNAPEDSRDMVLNAAININGTVFMFSDIFDDMPYTVGNNIGLVIIHEENSYIMNLVEKLKAGGEVLVQPEKTFWSPCYARVKDKYGIIWEISQEGEVEEVNN